MIPVKVRDTHSTQPTPTAEQELGGFLIALAQLSSIDLKSSKRNGGYKVDCPSPSRSTTFMF